MQLYLICIGIGIVVELLGSMAKLWTVRTFWVRLAHVAGAYGIFLGSLVNLLDHSWTLRAIIGMTFGASLMLANRSHLNWWQFRKQRLGPLRGQMETTLGIMLFWGIITLLPGWVAAWI